MTDLSEVCVHAGCLAEQRISRQVQKTKTLPQAHIPERRDKGKFLTGNTVSRKNSVYTDAPSVCET